MTPEPLLPSNQTPLEAALARVMRPTVQPEVLRTLWDADRCPVAWLPWLAWALAVDGWELAESEDARRALVKGSLALHRKKGTPWAVREVIRRLGFGEVTIIEGRRGGRRDGAFVRNGEQLRGRTSAWAEYIVKLRRPVTRDQADKLWRAIERYAPARSKLAALDYAAVAIRHNGIAVRDGQYTRGSITT
ncbi:phage tail protein I [Burkholderia multivorans]|uniref:phage tail protein I n=1 Tax=Burkholderia multivorans TaxID=87883 RepID=UPI000CFEAE99|nr:phage tail protein I [Burkholderia multivorans]MBU9120142.1 phage tail protein I [Burkholderia multivorans]MBU9135134.1 phage tail protein I [Burkholderia multivorans]MCO1461003.1 phage tail protein I [Burkholderia multivorans]MDN8005719.1 phage tail protein I [Burkholderia multivorans]PRF47585.1 phage tail protein I [Burkholderia multivorans]